jgi:putative phosphoesterase
MDTHYQKIAVISDIHGNIAALEAVLADIENHNVDVIVNLGDILSGPLYPVETAERLMALNVPTIRGNHERQLLTMKHDEMGLSDYYAASCLHPRHLAWIKSLPETLWLNDDILLVHGSPDHDLTYFLETVEKTGARPASLAEIESRAGATPAKLILCGHTHMPRIIHRLNGTMIVNPGSVGLQAYEEVHPWQHIIETGSPQARYALIEQKNNIFSATLIMVDYAWESAAKIADTRGRPDWAHALRNGTMPTMLT